MIFFTPDTLVCDVGTNGNMHICLALVLIITFFKQNISYIDFTPSGTSDVSKVRLDIGP